MSHAFTQIKTKLVKSSIIHLDKLTKSTDKQVAINTWLVVGVLFFGVFYLAQVNGLATKGYHMKELQKKIATLSQDNNKMQLQSIESQSFSSIEGKIQTLGLVSSEHLDYLKANMPVAVAR